MGRDISKFIWNEFCVGESKKDHYELYCSIPNIVKIKGVLAQNMVIIKMWFLQMLHREIHCYSLCSVGRAYNRQMTPIVFITSKFQSLKTLIRAFLFLHH